MKRLLLLSVLIWITNAEAVRVNTIYQAELPVPSQSGSDRTRAMPQAFEQVLIKASGKSKILENPNIKSQIPRAESLMQAFGYTAEKNTFLLNIQFDSESVNKILTEASAPIWGLSRPLVVAWILSEFPNHTSSIIDCDAVGDIPVTLKQAAKRRGLPFILPTMDMTDINQVTPSDITLMKWPVLENASKRYVSDVILVARISQSPNLFSVQAKLFQDSKQWDINVSGKSAVDVSNALIDSVTDTLAEQYATVVTNQVQERLVLHITQISKQEDYEQLMHYLQHLPSVASAEIETISGTDVVLNISLHGSRDSFTQSILVGKKLIPGPHEPGVSEFVYQWNQ